DAQLLAVASHQALQVHEAGHVRSGDHLRAGALVIGDPIAAHRAGDRLLGDGKGPAEPAALVGARQLGEPQAVEAFEQRAHLGEALDQPFAAAAEPQLPEGQTTCSNGANTSSILRASGRASSKKPEFAIGWPQQVCASGKWTLTPYRSRISAVASPTRG